MNTLELENHLNELYQVHQFKDYAPNGLQVEGSNGNLKPIKKIAVAVTASLEAIEHAAKWGAEVLVTHHGILWDHQGVRPIKGPYGQRVRSLMESELSLLSYHLPMDGHRKLGNAVGMAHKLKLKNLRPLIDAKKNSIGFYGEFSKQIFPEKLEKDLAQILGRSVTSIIFDSKSMIKRVGIITGGGRSLWGLAKQSGCHAYITGEITEYNYHDCRESEIHYFAGGHHATEVFGPKLLSTYLQKLLGRSVQVKFFDSKNPG